MEQLIIEDSIVFLVLSTKYDILTQTKETLFDKHYKLFVLFLIFLVFYTPNIFNNLFKYSLSSNSLIAKHFLTKSLKDAQHKYNFLFIKLLIINHYATQNSAMSFKTMLSAHFL